MPGTATLDDIVDEPKAGGVATLADIDESPPPATLSTKRGGSSGILPPAPPEPSKPSWRDYAGAAWATLTGAAPGAETGLSDTTSQEVSRHLKQVQTPGERATGALGLASEGLEAATPIMGPAMLENPAAIARGLGEGIVASKGAGYVAKKLGATEEQRQDIESLAMWAPGVARSVAASLGLAKPKVGVQTGPEGTAAGISGSGGTRAGVAVTPEEIRIGGQFKGGKPRSVSIPRKAAAPVQPAIEAPTIEGQVVPPAPHPGAPVDNMAEGASNAVAMANEEAQAMRMVSGLPATPPPPPVPPPPAPPVPPEVANNHVSPETVQKIGSVIAKVPAELRPQAIIEAHQTLSDALLQQGKVVTPDGTLEIITKPEQAEKVAQRIINDEVKRADKEAEEKAKESGQTGAAAATTEAAPQKVKPLPKPEVQSAHVSEIQEEPGTAKISDIATAETGKAEGQLRETPSKSAGIAGNATTRSEPAGATAGGNPPASNGGNAAGQAKEAVSSVQATPKFQKGDQVVLKDGTKAEVTYTHPTMSIVRVKTADGRKLSLGSKSLSAAPSVESKPVTTPQGAGEKSAQPATTPAGATSKNPLSLKGKPFWIGAVDSRDGFIEETHPHETAEAADFHHSHYFSREMQQKLKDGEAHIFWGEPNGKINFWDGSQWADKPTPTEETKLRASIKEQLDKSESSTSPAKGEGKTTLQEPAGATISKESEAQPTPKQETAVQPVGAKTEKPLGDVLKPIAPFHLEQVKTGWNVVDKNGTHWVANSTKDGGEAALKRLQDRYEADEKHGPLVIKTIHGRTETMAKPLVDAGSTIEEAGKHEQPISANPSTAGGRPLSATEGNGRGELAGAQPEASSTAGKGGNAPEESGQRGVPSDHNPPAERTEGIEPRPGERTGLREPATTEPRAERVKPTTPKVSKNNDWFQHPEDFSVDATSSTRLEWNTKALTIVKNVLEKGEKLTDEDRDALAHYVGWGALDKAFNPGWGSDSDMWHRASRKLEELMTPEELAAARRSTQNAHYTSPQIVRFVWSALSRMGFKGGVVLEPSMGTGNFFGMMPKGIRSASQAIGNELDPTTYNIAKLLYPSATNFNKDFVDLMLPNDSVDLAVSNVPFGVQVFDPVYRKLGKPAIHDYFFIKSLDKVRPGGVVAFITSTYTLDKQNPSIRELLADKADLLFAVRMPQDTFDKSSGAAVSTDLIVLRKRAPGAKPEGENFVGLRDTQAKYEPYFYDKAGQTATKQINEYYANNPQNVLGELVIGRGRTSSNPEMLVAKRTDDFEDRLKRALERVPRNSFLSKAQAAPVLAADLDEQFAPDHLEEGNLALDDKGQVRQRVNGKLVATTAVLDKEGKPSYTLQDRAKQLIGIRDATKALMLQMRTQPDEPAANKAIERTQAQLLKKIEAYRSRHGWFSERKTKDVFSEDPHYPLLLSLEEYDKTQKVGTPTDILSKRTIYPEAKLTALASDPKDAFYQVLGERGRPDLDFMAALSGKTVEEIARPLIERGLLFKEPNTHEWQTREKYLSGYVRDKLADAKKAVEQGHKEFEANVRELEKAQPADVPINSGDPDKDIQVKLGATWISTTVLEQFAKDVLRSGYYASIKTAAGQWKVENLGNSAEMTEFGGGGMPASELLELALNLKQPVVKETYKDADGNTREVVNADKTIAAKRAQQKLKDEFAKWARNHKTIGPMLEQVYNQTMNNLVEPSYDGSHLTFPGMNKSVLRGGQLQPHQSDAVWRIVQDGRALLAHVVGAGKTYEIIASAMEMKRLGMIRKPMIAVPNHLVGQWAKDFLKLYPGAKILVPDKKDFESVRRNRIMSKIATGDWDAVILPHSQFNLMDISPERQLVTLGKELDELEETYAAAKAKEGGKKGFTVKRLEKARDKLRARMAELKDLKADKTVRFDDLGVDQLFVDEAHAYKNLAFYTKMDRVAGLAQGDSKRATRLKMKTDYLLEKHGNRGVVFATGTPIQNTMAEIYNMIKYIAPDALERAGIRFFDDWAANFGETITAMELGVDGRTYKPRSKFARFTNVPELQQMFRSFADVKTKEDLNLPVPEIEGGKPMALTARPTPELEEYVKQLIERAKRCRGEGGPRPDPKVDNMLKVTGDGRKAATDLRLIDPNLPDDPDSKINTVVNKIHEEWESGRVDKLTQAIFLDNYQYLEEVGAQFDEEGKQTKKGKETALLNLYRDMTDKLVAKGIPRADIAIIHDYDKQEQKTELFRKMNAGEVRVLFGSTEKMGAGMNAQERMKSLIDVDSPWRPGDLEQRHGRILRQGNTNKTVRIYHAVTKGTFDSYMIQTLKGKAEFINQVMSGKFKGRTMTDAAGDMVLSLEEMLAASSNNPDVKKKMELEAEVATLGALEREHEASMYRNKRRAEGLRDDAAKNETTVESWKKVQSDWDRATEGDKFSFNILGKKFTEYKDAADWIKDQEAPAVPFHFEINGVPGRFSLRAEYVGIKDSPMLMNYTVGPFQGPMYERTLDNFPMLLASSYGYLNPKNVASRIRTAELQAAENTEKAEKLEKLSEKSGFEDADRLNKAKEELEATKKRLGLSDDQSAKEQDVAAEVDSTPEKSDEGEEEEKEPGILKRLATEETGTLEPGVIGKSAAGFYKQDVAPALDKAGIGIKDTAALFIKALYPRIEESNPVGRWTRTAAPSDAVDTLMKLKGDRARALSEFDAILSGIEKMFDKMDDSDRVNFIDRMQTGQDQDSAELDGIASALRTIMDEQRRQEEDAANLGRKGQLIELSRKQNYFHNWWNTPPGREVEADDHERISRLFSPKRPLEGSKGYNKRQSYTLKGGIAAGGVPETTNPVRVLRHRIEDGMKFVTARVAWDSLHNLDLRTYVRQGERPPAGFDKIDDKIAKVYFPAWLDFPGSDEPIKVPHQLGEWYVEANTARLLKNMLSVDKIRGTAAGRSLMWLKNSSTALELGLSPFHAVFETIEAASSQLALGLQRSYNLGIRGGDMAALGKGIMEMATSPVAPITLAREGAALPAYVEARVRLAKIGITEFGSPQIEGKQPHGIAEAIPHFREVRRQAAIRRLLKQYPDLDQLVDDMFTGGLIIGQHRDYQVRAFGKTAAEAWTAGNHLGAILRAGMSLPQAMMKPLFQWYIPNLKYSLFLKQMSEQAQEHADELEDGSLTRAALARRVADSVENRFGELNFDNLFLDRTVKTALQFAFRSVTYKLGTAREFIGAAGGQSAELAKWAQQAYGGGEDKGPGALPRLDPRASWVFSLLVTTVAMGTIMAKLLSHKYPWEWLEEDKKEGGGDLRHLYLETVHPRTGDVDSRKKPVRISLPTYWKDVEHVTSSPSQYVLSSLSTTLSKGLDLAENRDYFGNYVYNPNDPFATKAKQAGKYAFPTPFSFSNYQRGKQMNEPKTAWMSAFGFPRAPSDLDFTPAEKALRDVIKASRAPATPEQMEEWMAKREAFKEGKLSPAEARRFIKRERESFLEREFKNSAVTYTDAVRIHNLATPEEKPLLDRLLRIKRANQLKRYGLGEVERKEAEAAN